MEQNAENERLKQNLKNVENCSDYNKKRVRRNPKVMLIR